jgi:hypothetical protein
MQCKLLVALQLEVVHHFIERCAGGRTSRVEPPATFRATKTAKTLLFNPHQFPAHDRLCRCAPSPSGPMAWYALAVKGRNILVRHNVSFGSGVLPDGSRNRWSQRKMCRSNERSLHVPIWIVCWASYRLGRVPVRANVRVRKHVCSKGIAQAVGLTFRASRCLARGSGEANVRCSTEASCLDPV